MPATVPIVAPLPQLAVLDDDGRADELWTGIAVPVIILLGVRINRWVPALAEYSNPPAVTGGLLIAILLAVAVLAQVMLTVLIATLLVYPLLNGRDGAIGDAGFVGFGLGAMPVAR